MKGRALATAAATLVLALGFFAFDGTPQTPAPQFARVSGGGTSALPHRAYDFVDVAGCDVSADGVLWYALPAGSFPPLDLRFARCERDASFDNAHPAPLPEWARPDGPTQAVVAVVSLQGPYAPAGMETLERVARAAHVPVTWMPIDWPWLVREKSRYDAFHRENGDGLEVAPYRDLIAYTQAHYAWFRPRVAVAAGIPGGDARRAIALGMPAFWGTTWNSTGIDGIHDIGAPWGTYCADPASYKRPATDGECRLLSIEWTARDLTRAFHSTREDLYSTDTEDIAIRAGLRGEAADAYLRALVDAYAAAGEVRPLVMVLNEESDQVAAHPVSPHLLGVMYRRAVADGMHPMTLAQVAQTAPAFSREARAIAFPFIPVTGGVPFSYDGAPVAPATIDFHDLQIGLTFVAPRALPTRAFLYADSPNSARERGLVPYDVSRAPKLLGVSRVPGALVFRFSSERAAHYGIALWADPERLGLAGTGVTRAGRAGAVVTFDLPAGFSERRVACLHCDTATLPLPD